MQLSLTSALYLVSFIQSAYLLLATPLHRGRSLLLLFLGAIALLMADYLVWDNAWLSPSVQFWVNRFTHASLTYALGPCLYLYFRLNSEPGFQLKPSHMWYGVPYAIALVLSMSVFPLYLPVWNLYTQTWLLPANTWPQTLRSFHSLIFAWLTGRLLWLRVPQQDRITLKNMLTMAILLMGAGSLLISLGTYLLPDTHYWKPYSAGMAAICAIVMLYLLNRLLTEQQAGWLTITPVTALSNKSVEPPTKYQNSALNTTAAIVLFEKLELYIAESRAYEDADLTLPKLAQELNVSSNQLSQAVNQAGKQSFHELINRHRVMAACVLLADPKQQHLSVLGIGYEVGFRSKSTYYSAFRREKGVTPSIYRKQTH